MKQTTKYDCFISHASEDKKVLVEKIAHSLQNVGVSVWYDDFELTAGDSLMKKIDYGLATSKYGLIVLSRAFISKPWPEYELRGLSAREIGSDKVIIPIWYRISRDDILRFSPPLADKLAIIANGRNTGQVISEVLRVIRPDIHESLTRIKAYEKLMKSKKTVSVPISQIDFGGKIRHSKLPPSMLIRLRNVRAALQEVFPQNFTEMVDDFRKDLRPEKELFIWEGITAAFSCYRELFSPSLKELRDVFAFLLTASTNGVEATLKDDRYEFLDAAKKYAIVRIWAYIGQPVEIIKEESRGPNKGIETDAE